MEIIGRKYQAEECFLSDLLMAGETMKEGMKILEPHFNVEEVRVVGKVVIGTVKGDLYDIGKNIVTLLLKAAGFEVVDLRNLSIA
jgi:5-methyltetrahydrofolate--homocysteine methyltransferase